MSSYLTRFQPRRCTPWAAYAPEREQKVFGERRVAVPTSDIG